MKTVTIRLPDVEAAMLTAVQKRDVAYRKLDYLVMDLIKERYNQLENR